MIAHAIRWVVGGMLYGGLELLYRGHTHWTMLLLAALLCVPLDLANEHIPWEWPLWAQAVAGGTTCGPGWKSRREPCRCRRNTHGS